MYGSSSGAPSTVTRPCASQHCTVCPPTAITRLTKSFSLGGATPTVPADRAQRLRERVGRLGDGDLRRPGRRPLEHDDVAAARGSREPVDDLVDQHPVAGAAGAAVQRLLHRAGRDEERLDQERLDQQRQHERDQEQDRQLAPERARASAGLRSAWAAAGRLVRLRARAGCRRGSPSRSVSSEQSAGAATRCALVCRRVSVSARGVALLLDLGGLAAQVAQVVELRAADVTAGDDLDLLDDGVCTGKVRSTPTPKLTLRTVKVSRTPPPWRRMTTPWKTWMRERCPR